MPIDIRIKPPKHRQPDRKLVYSPPPKDANGNHLKSQYDHPKMSTSGVQPIHAPKTRPPR